MGLLLMTEPTAGQESQQNESKNSGETEVRSLKDLLRVKAALSLNLGETVKRLCSRCKDNEAFWSSTLCSDCLDYLVENQD